MKKLNILAFPISLPWEKRITGIFVPKAVEEYRWGNIICTTPETTS